MRLRRTQEELLAAGVLVDELPAEVEADEPPVVVLDAPFEDDSDLAGLLVLLVAVSEPDERESVR